MRKPRSDSKLANMPEEQQAQLVEWLLAGVPYHEAIGLLKKEFGVATSIASLSHFYQSVVGPHLLRRRMQALGVAEEIATEASAKPGQFDSATIDALKQKAFELAISPGAKAGDVKALFTLLQKHRDQDIKQQQVDLAQRRLEVVEAKLKAVNEQILKAKDGGITPETLSKIEEAARIL